MNQHTAQRNQPAQRLQALNESQTLAMARRSREMKAAGIDVINLSIGEPDFDTPDFVKDAGIRAIQQNKTHYPPVPGIPELRAAIAEKFKRDNHITCTPDMVVVSTGAKQSIANVVLSTINPGDEVIIPTPYWVSYLELVKMAGGIPVFIKSGVHNNYKITADDLKAALTEKTRMLIFSSPCNPSGSVYSETEIRSLASVLQSHPDVLVVSDEIYEYINYTGNHFSMGAIPEVAAQVITVNGVSKGFAMTGWRIGYICAAPWIAKACEKMQGQFTSGTSTISQYAALAAVEAGKGPVMPMREEFFKRRELVLQLINDIPGLHCNIPDGAFYVFPDVRSFFGKSCDGMHISNAADLCNFLLEKGHVALVSGDAFGDDNCLRFSYACAEKDIREAIRRMKESLSMLR
ncbi:MAG: pyridoxal phosphate-dependent aminotransferase [Bacteroidota bacterium]|jgi:aspartate aminotransferase